MDLRDHPGGQLRGADPRISRVVVDGLIGVQAHQLPSGPGAISQEHAKFFLARENRCREPGRARPNNADVVDCSAAIHLTQLPAGFGLPHQPLELLALNDLLAKGLQPGGIGPGEDLNDLERDPTPTPAIQEVEAGISQNQQYEPAGDTRA